MREKGLSKATTAADGKTYGKDKKGGDAHAVHQGITDVVTGLAQQVGIAFAGLDTLVARTGKQVGGTRQGDHHQHEGGDHGDNYACGPSRPAGAKTARVRIFRIGCRFLFLSDHKRAAETPRREMCFFPP